MSARDKILQNVRKNLPPASALPEHAGPWIEYPDPFAQFSTVLQAIGGQALRVPDLAAVQTELERMPLYMAAAKVVSLVDGVGRQDLPWNSIEQPAELEPVDFAILPGEFPVAENAAVWVTDRLIRHRVLFFICQHLALVVPSRGMVHHMHAAYDQITFEPGVFGTFIAGPSKTADIEQSLVIGAHGPKSMTVFLVDAL